MAESQSIPKTRICTKCKLPKPATLEHFRAEKRTIIGLQATCRDCDRERRREARRLDPDADRRYYEANKHWLLPQMLERLKRIRAENGEEAQRMRDAKNAWRAKNVEKAREYQNNYFQRNRDKELKRLASYYEANPDKRQEANARREEWRKANREKARSYVRNRRARIKQSEGQHSAADIAKILEGQKRCCWWCSKKLSGKKYHVDHRIPIARGGSNGPENLVISCAPCNQKKNSKMPWEMDNPRLL